MDLRGKIINYKYRIGEKLSESGFSSVYSAVNRLENDKTVIIKVLNPDRVTTRKEDIIRFRSEIIAVSRIDHPGVLKVYEVGQVDDMHYLVMERVEGENLARLLDLKNGLSLDDRLDIVKQLCVALSAVHDHDIIHKGVNPGNVIVRNGMGEHSVTLINFAFPLIRDFGKITDIDDIVATFGYMSPEQSGIISWNVDNRSDLYSVGVMMYRMLTGRIPFTGDDVRTIIHHHIAMLPEPPGEIDPSIPPALEKITLKLLEKEPGRRYQDARGLLEDLKKYMSGDRDFIPGAEKGAAKLRYLTGLTGRDEEYRKLIGVFDAALHKKGRICLISGEFGIGKTRLVEEMIANIYYHRGTFIKGNSLPGDNRVPYGAIKEALDEYYGYYSEYSEGRRQAIRDHLSGEIGDLGEIIVEFNPLMGNIIGAGPGLVELRPDRETKRFLMTVSRFFYSLSIVENGMVLVLDNMQWMDESGYSFLQEIVRHIEEYPLLIIGLYRPDEISDDHNLAKLVSYARYNRYPVEEIRLAPLNRASMNGLVAGLLKGTEDGTRELSDFIMDYSKGNPYFAVEILKQLVENGAAADREGRWAIDYQMLEKLDIAPSIIELIVRNATLLKENERSIITTASVIGVRFDIETLFKITKYTDEEVIDAVDRATGLQLINHDPGEKGVFLFNHMRIHESFYRSVPEEKRKMMHLTVAKLLEEAHGGDIESALFEITYHYTESGNREKTLEYAYPAGIKAKLNHANDESIRYFKLMVKHLEENGLEGDARWMSSMEEAGRIAQKIGRVDESIDILIKTLKHTKDVFKKAEMYRLISQGYFIKGDWPNCELFGKTGLSLIGETVPIPRFMVVISIIKETIGYAAHRLFPPRVRKSNEHGGSEKSRIIVNFYMTLNWMYILSNMTKFIRSVLRMINISLAKIGESRELGMSVAVFGSLLMVIPFFKKAVKYHTLALHMRQETGDLFGVAQSLQFMGFCYCYQGDYALSINYFNRSRDIFARIGDVWETAMVMNGLGYDYFYLGQYEEMITHFSAYLDISEKINDYYGISVATANLCLAHAQRGSFDESESFGRRALSLSEKHSLWYPFCFANINYGYLMMEKENYEEAVAYFEKARKLYRENIFLKDYTIYLYSLLAEAYMEVKKIGRGGPPKKSIKRICAVNLRRTARWKNHLAAAHRTQAMYLFSAGNYKKAERHYRKAIRLSAELGRRYEMAKGLYEYGIFLQARESADSAETRLGLALQIFKEIGAAAYVRRLEAILGITRGDDISSIRMMIDRQRMYSIIRVSQDISSIMNLDDLLEKVMAVSIEVTGAQRGYLLIADEETGELRIAANKNVNPRDRTDTGEMIMPIVEEVYKTGKTRHIRNAMEDEKYSINPNVMKFGLKSILCIPLKYKDEVRGVCYLDNSLSGSVFTDEDSDILGIIMTQAAISIENVLLYELGITDGLTKLVTHRHFQNLLQKELTKALRFKREVSLVMIDIDDFKSFNDTYGHQLGDEVLRSVSNIVKSNCRTIDIAARYGGEELILVLPETPIEEALRVAERIRSRVESCEIEHMGRILHVTISLGIALYPLHAADRESLIKAADDAMYTSKEAGKNRVSLFGSPKSNSLLKA